MKCKSVKKISNFAKCEFNTDNFLREYYCLNCRKKIVTDLDKLKDYLTMNNTSFNEKNWSDAYAYIKEREFKKYDANNLPENINSIIFKKAVSKYFSQANLEVYGKEVKGVSNNSNKKSNKKTYSKKWMGDYTEEELDYLEQYLSGLYNDFKIITTNHRDYAMKIAKASLHMDKCYQDLLGGVTGADSKYKTSRETFDALSKSAQFAESQRGQNDVSLGCFGKVFEKVEQKKWIYQHKPMEKDNYDKLIDQFSHIDKSL